MAGVSPKTFPSTRFSWIRARRASSVASRAFRPAQARRPVARYIRAHMSQFRHRLALKIVLPFAALTLAIGALGTLTATSALSSRSQEAFDNHMIDDDFVAQRMVQAGDPDRRSILRLLSSGPAPSHN